MHDVPWQGHKKVAEPTLVMEGVQVFDFEAPLWHANCEQMKKRLEECSDGEIVVLDMTCVSFVDATAIISSVSKVRGSRRPPQASLASLSMQSRPVLPRCVTTYPLQLLGVQGC